VTTLRFGLDSLPPSPRLAGLPVLAAAEPPPLADPAAALAHCLSHPQAGPALSEFVAGCRKVCVVLPDGTRPLPTALVEELLAALAGVPEVLVRVANGTHRRTARDEHQKLLGRFFGKVEVGDRLADDPSAHAVLPGPLSPLSPHPHRPPAIDRLAAESDALVLMGPAAFHYLAGFGGGGKLVAPGLADRATAEHIHGACLSPSGGRHPDARPGAVDSPLRARLEEVCRRAPKQFYVVPLLDSSYRAVSLFAGERQAAFAASCEALAKGWGVPCRRYQTVIVSAGGHPYDVDFVQAHKAWEMARAACQDGGHIVWIARCPEGLPARHASFLAQHRTAQAMEAALRQRFDIAAHTVWAARLKAESAKVVAVTELADEVVSALGMRKAESLEKALDCVPLDDAAVLPFGSRFLPIGGPG
jgi:lactate racemase